MVYAVSVPLALEAFMSLSLLYQDVHSNRQFRISTFVIVKHKHRKDHIVTVEADCLPHEARENRLFGVSACHPGSTRGRMQLVLALGSPHTPRRLDMSAPMNR